MMRVVGLLTVVALSLSACATPETRLMNGLQRAGLSKPMSACMADRMVDRLSLTQLRRLSSLEGVQGAKLRDVPTEEFLHKVRALKDPEILGVSTSSAAICAVKQI